MCKLPFRSPSRKRNWEVHLIIIVSILLSFDVIFIFKFKLFSSLVRKPTVNLSDTLVGLAGLAVGRGGAGLLSSLLPVLGFWLWSGKWEDFFLLLCILWAYTLTLAVHVWVISVNFCKCLPHSTQILIERLCPMFLYSGPVVYTKIMETRTWTRYSLPLRYKSAVFGKPSAKSSNILLKILIRNPHLTLRILECPQKTCKFWKW